MAHRKDVSDLLRLAARAGCEIGRRRNDRIKIIAPDGHQVFITKVPNDWRATANVRALLRRHGAVI